MNQNSKDSDRFVKDPAEVNLRRPETLSDAEHIRIIEMIDWIRQRTQKECETRLFIQAYNQEQKRFNTCETIELARSLGFVVIRRRIKRNPDESYAYYQVSYLGWQYYFRYVREGIYRRLGYREKP